MLDAYRTLFQRHSNMPISIYDATVPALVRGLTILSGYTDKAAAYAEEKKFKPDILVNARLAPDMLSLSGQLQRSSDSSKGAIARLTSVTVPSFPDTETTLPELKERLTKTIDFLNTVKPADFEGAETKSIELKFGSLSKTLTGDAFVTSFLLPNFYFHVAMAHAILRHNGVKVGKLDYLGA
jgi:hypothetical protein